MVKRWLNRYLKRKQLLAQAALEQRFIVIDLELTGLDPKQHEIVSVAWVMLEQQCIKLSQAEHHINKGVKQLDQSPVYHGIARQDIAKGLSLKMILTQLSAHFEDTILVFHNSTLDWGFLKLAYAELGITVRPKLILDTLQIEKKRLHQQGHDIALDELTLSACRERYELPHYTCHHALTDAMATAELLLAQCHQISRGQALKLRELL